MKGLSQYLNISLTFFCLVGLHVMIVNVISIEAQGTLTAKDLLAEKEKELNRFVRAVEANSRNCDALNECSGVNCSRSVCHNDATPGDPNYQCLGVFKFADCGPTCAERNFDYSKGFVRRMDEVESHMQIARTVCTQRTLDDYFKSSSMNDSSHFFQVYFASVDGTVRIYPGADGNCSVEARYDPRIRPWFLESTYVPKNVTVLLDSGPNMGNELPAGDKNETYISKAINTILKLLETLTDEKDYVNIMSFDGDGIKALIAKPTRYDERLNQSFSDNLTQIVNSGSTKDPSASTTSSAINTAIAQLNSSDPGNYLKVVIVLSGGQQFQALTELNISANTGVNVFVYNFQTKGRLAECNPTIRASSEEIPVESIDNPLYALQLYYSFLAKIHRHFLGDQTDYGQRYIDASEIDNSTLTISKAAFGASGELLGVVGIDFFQKKVEAQYTMQFESIVDAARDNDPRITYQNSEYLKTSVCFNHTDTCPGANTNVQIQFMCGKKNDDPEIGCCGTCKPSMPSKAKESEWGKILGGVGAGIVGLLVIAVIVCCCWPRIARRREDENTLGTQFTFPGPDNETVSRQ